MSLAPEKIALLRTELESDPVGLGYSDHIAAGRDGDIESLINAITGPGVGTVTLPSVPTPAVLLGLAPAMLILNDKDEKTRDRWDRIIGTIQAVDTLTINASNLATFGLAIVDGLLTLQQAEAIYKRPGTRAEVLFGVNAYADSSDIAKALRG